MEESDLSLQLSKFGEANSQDIQMLESTFDIYLPDDYSRYLKMTNGGRNIDYQNLNALSLPVIDEVVNIDFLYGINTGVRNTEIKRWTELFLHDLPPKSLIIGSSIQNGFIVLILEKEYEGVYYYDDSYYLDSSSDEENTYFISSTFTDFINMVKS